jgi:Replication-relaxation
VIRSDGRAGRVGAAAVAALASRLTERDRLVALACYEHRVLTTEQLRRLHFGSSRRARWRLERLYQLRVLDRFRPPRERGQGSAPFHWLLDEAGAHVVAEALGVERSELRWRHQAAVAIASSSKLSHQLEVNEFFTRLAEDASQTGGRLAAWWGERRCLAALGGQAAPDGYGRLELPGQRPVSFLLEVDRATERPAERLRQKARRYARALPRSPLAEEAPLILLAVPTPARRDHLAQALAKISAPIRTVVWTPPRSPLDALSEALAASPLAPSPTLADAEIPDPEPPTAPVPPPAPHA